MYCPKCGSRVIGLPQSSACERTGATLSEMLYSELMTECVLRLEQLEHPPLRFQVGGTWYCPGCACLMIERDGDLSCSACGCRLNRFIHSLIEFYIHPPVSLTPAQGGPNALLRAAMYGQREVARAIWHNSPDLRSTRGANGESPVALALAAGHFGTAVALLRAESPEALACRDPAAILEGAMSELSDEVACAGWLKDLEHLLWHVAHSAEVLPDSIDYSGFSDLPPLVREDLAWLSIMCGGWVHYGEGGTEFLPASAWEIEHARWRASWQTPACS